MSYQMMATAEQPHILHIYQIKAIGYDLSTSSELPHSNIQQNGHSDATLHKLACSKSRDEAMAIEA